MTHIVHPYIQRVGVIRTWNSQWFANNAKEYREQVKVEHILRTFLEKKAKGMMIDTILLERKKGNVLSITIKTARPGMLIGKGGASLETLKKSIEKQLSKNKVAEKITIELNIEEIKFIEPHASLVAESIVEALEKRMPFRRVLKQMAEKVIANTQVEGVRITLSGRLGGAEIARVEQIRLGRVPLQTLRSDIDFAQKRAVLSYGTIGVSVWVYRGDIHTKKKK